MTIAGLGRDAMAPPPNLHGNRQGAEYLVEGRLVVCFRDIDHDIPARDHFVARVGPLWDILRSRQTRLVSRESI
jgi:hypothetical protein